MTYFVGYDPVRGQMRAISTCDGAEIILDIDKWKEEIQESIDGALSQEPNNMDITLDLLNDIGVPEEVRESMRNNAGRTIGNRVDDMRLALTASFVLRYPGGEYVALRDVRIADVSELMPKSQGSRP